MALCVGVCTVCMGSLVGTGLTDSLVTVTDFSVIVCAGFVELVSAKVNDTSCSKYTDGMRNHSRF